MVNIPLFAIFKISGQIRENSLICSSHVCSTHRISVVTEISIFDSDKYSELLQNRRFQTKQKNLTLRYNNLSWTLLTAQTVNISTVQYQWMNSWSNRLFIHGKIQSNTLKSHFAVEVNSRWLFFSYVSKSSFRLNNAENPYSFSQLYDIWYTVYNWALCFTILLSLQLTNLNFIQSIFISLKKPTVSRSSGPMSNLSSV